MSISIQHFCSKNCGIICSLMVNFLLNPNSQKFSYFCPIIILFYSSEYILCPHLTGSTYPHRGTLYISIYLLHKPRNPLLFVAGDNIFANQIIRRLCSARFEKNHYNKNRWMAGGFRASSLRINKA